MSLDKTERESQRRELSEEQVSVFTKLGSSQTTESTQGNRTGKNVEDSLGVKEKVNEVEPVKKEESEAKFHVMQNPDGSEVLQARPSKKLIDHLHLTAADFVASFPEEERKIATESLRGRSIECAAFLVEEYMDYLLTPIIQDLKTKKSQESSENS